MPPTPYITAHATRRYQERVDPGASRAEARLALEQIASLGRASARARHWTRRGALEPGTVCIYWASRPGVGLIAKDGAIIIVVPRELCRGQARRRPVRLIKPPPDRERRWRWNGELEAA
jgi:hypothetical protein